MSILDNAIDSIAIGLEDFQSDDSRRLLSATRNIYAGILLLFKHKLAILSPNNSDEVLIKERVIPFKDSNDEISWIGTGKKTVDVKSIKERFEALDIKTDWKRVEKIQKYRNDIEHYYNNSRNELTIRELISDCFLLIKDFITDELEEDAKEVLGDDNWQYMLKSDELFQEELKRCKESIESLEHFIPLLGEVFKNINCLECSSELVFSNITGVQASEVDEYECRACGNINSYEEVITNLLEDFYQIELYQSRRNNLESPFAECPECGGLYIYDEGICAICGHEVNHICDLCNCTIPPEEIVMGGNMCGYCIHRMEKIRYE